MRPADLRTLAASRSHLLLLPDDERDALLDEIDELAATHPDLRGRDMIDVPYRTECYRARLPLAGCAARPSAPGSSSATR